MVVLFKMFAKSHMKKKYPIEGFTVEWKRNDSNEIHFDIARCLYRNMCEKYCCPELCTVFCQSDITAFSGYEPKIRFERAGTLGEGAACCDFHFIHGSHYTHNQSQSSKSQTLRHRADKLVSNRSLSALSFIYS